jgi:hypothetical protein
MPTLDSPPPPHPHFVFHQVKLFAHFYKADLVVASPLGLRLGLGAEGETNADADWLSSIEVGPGAMGRG